MSNCTKNWVKFHSFSQAKCLERKLVDLGHCLQDRRPLSVPCVIKNLDNHVLASSFEIIEI